MLLPNKKYGEYVWLNGHVIDANEGLIPITTHGLHYGSCVFEGIRAYAGNIFKAQEHYDRLHHSAKLLGFSLVYSSQELIEATKYLLNLMHLHNAYIRPFAWRGATQLTIGAPQSDINVAIACWNFTKYSDIKNSISLNISKWQKPSPATIPWESKAAGLYINCTLSKHEALMQGFDDALMLDYRGYIAESTSSNIFLAIDDQLHTPIADCFLNGITRQTVIKLAQENNIEIIERHLILDDLANTQEAFLTGTASGIIPIRQIKDYHFTPSVITEKIIKLYDLITCSL